MGRTDGRADFSVRQAPSHHRIGLARQTDRCASGTQRYQPDMHRCSQRTPITSLDGGTHFDTTPAHKRPEPIRSGAADCKRESNLRPNSVIRGCSVRRRGQRLKIMHRAQLPSIVNPDWSSIQARTHGRIEPRVGRNINHRAAPRRAPTPRCMTAQAIAKKHNRRRHAKVHARHPPKNACPQPATP